MRSESEFGWGEPSRPVLDICGVLCVVAGGLWTTRVVLEHIPWQWSIEVDGDVFLFASNIGFIALAAAGPTILAARARRPRAARIGLLVGGVGGVLGAVGRGTFLLDFVAWRGRDLGGRTDFLMSVICEVSLPLVVGLVCAYEFWRCRESRPE